MYLLPAIEAFSVRPPTRSRASRTTTEWPAATSARAAARPENPAPTTTTSALRRLRDAANAAVLSGASSAPSAAADARSEERRVGKEGRYRWAAEHLKEKTQ